MFDDTQQRFTIGFIFGDDGFHTIDSSKHIGKGFGTQYEFQIAVEMHGLLRFDHSILDAGIELFHLFLIFGDLGGQLFDPGLEVFDLNLQRIDLALIRLCFCSILVGQSGSRFPVFFGIGDLILNVLQGTLGILGDGPAGSLILILDTFIVVALFFLFFLFGVGLFFLVILAAFFFGINKSRLTA